MLRERARHGCHCVYVCAVCMQVIAIDQLQPTFIIISIIRNCARFIRETGEEKREEEREKGEGRKMERGLQPDRENKKNEIRAQG